jgi:hypothetical protein
MQNDVYVSVGLDRKGNVVEVRVRGEAVRERQGATGQTRVGDSVPGCEHIVQTLIHELLSCRKKGAPEQTGGGTPPPSEVEDPCCYRDPATGKVWCWC